MSMGQSFVAPSLSLTMKGKRGRKPKAKPRGQLSPEDDLARIRAEIEAEQAELRVEMGPLFDQIRIRGGTHTPGTHACHFRPFLVEFLLVFVL
jgi:hypothetical protein